MQLRIRTVKPEFFKHEKLFDLEKETGLPIRLAWIGLCAIADREGRFNWRPRTIKAEILPYDTEIDFALILDALAAAGMLLRYEIEGELYGCIPTFKKHQLINTREAQSKIPPPDNYIETHVHAHALQCNARVEGKGREQKGREGEEATPPADASQNKTIGPVHAGLAGNSKRERVLCKVPLEIQQDWVDRYESKWLKDSILHAIQTHEQNYPIEDTKDWPAKLIRWFKIEKKPKFKQIVAELKPREPVVSQLHSLTPLNEIIGMNVMDALSVAKKQKLEDIVS